MILQVGFLAILAVGVYFGTQFAYTAFHEEAPAQAEDNDLALSVPPKELDLGRLWESTTHEHVIHITNVSERPVTISGFSRSCDCVAIAPSTNVTLQPHGSEAFALKLALVSRAAPPDGEPFVVRLAARYSVEGQSGGAAEWQLKAVILPTIRFNPPELRFGTRSDLQVIEESVKLELGPGIASVKGEGSPDWSVRVTRDEASGSPGKFTAALRYRGEAKFGLISGAIRFLPVDTQGQRLPIKELKVAGQVVRDVAASPADVSLGRQPCGTMGEGIVRIVSLTKRPFRIKRTNPSNPGLTITRILGADNDWLYSLQLRLTGAGDQQAVAGFLIEDEDGREHEVAVPVRYYGVQAP